MLNFMHKQCFVQNNAETAQLEKHKSAKGQFTQIYTRGLVIKSCIRLRSCLFCEGRISVLKR